jgi:DNA-binding NtrC family response regulator
VLDNKTILVLDDEELLLSYLVNDLRSAGYRAFGMESKRLGLHWMKEHRPDLVISDIYSPQMNGFEFINALKADPDLAHTPVIVVSGAADSEAAAKAMQLGAFEVFKKPCDLKELRGAIQKALRK